MAALPPPPPDELPALVGDLHAVNTSLQDSGFGPHLLCSLVTFPDAELRPLALVHLYKRGTFYPFAPLPRNKRDNPLELQIKAALKDDLRIEENLSRWFPLRGAPRLALAWLAGLSLAATALFRHAIAPARTGRPS